MIPAIMNRRSIRKYKADNLPMQAVTEILRAGILAPSAKNRQPWKFVVLQKNAKNEAVQAMRRGIERERKSPLLLESAKYLEGAEHTADVMEQAPVVIMVTDPQGVSFDKPLSPEERMYEICNAQSMGAAMENMTLTATELGLGSLWICDTFFAQKELTAWLCNKGEVRAALALGYADEDPPARPRKEFDALVSWRR